MVGTELAEPTVGTGPPDRRHTRRTGRTVVCLVLVALVAGALVDDLRTQVRLHHAQVGLTRSQIALVDASARLAGATTTLRSATVRRNTDQLSLEQVSGELASVQQTLAQAKEGLALQTLNIGTLTACVSGVEQAIASLQAGQPQAAITAIGAVAGPCQSLHGSATGGPVYPFDFPDPDVIAVGGTYYAYGTNAAGGSVQVIESGDLQHWKTVGDALPQLASWASPGSTWAPGVIERGRTFLLYYATLDRSGRGSRECISVATAGRPQGPFVDTTTAPLVCQVSLGGSIDPAPYVDGSGRPYLAWKSNGAGGRPATIWAQALARSGTRLAPGGGPVALLQPSQAWEASVVEGPFMWSSGGAYYLFYSGNNWNSASYGIGVAVCTGPVGPCTKPLGGPLYGSQPNLAGPGGASIFVDAQGTPWIAFHAWLPSAVGYPNARLLFVRPLATLGALPPAPRAAGGTTVRRHPTPGHRVRVRHGHLRGHGSTMIPTDSPTDSPVVATGTVAPPSVP